MHGSGLFTLVCMHGSVCSHWCVYTVLACSQWCVHSSGLLILVYAQFWFVHTGVCA